MNHSTAIRCGGHTAAQLNAAAGQDSAPQSRFDSLVGQVESELKAAHRDLDGLESRLDAALTPASEPTSDKSTPLPVYGSRVTASLGEILATVEIIRARIQDIAGRSEL